MIYKQKLSLEQFRDINKRELSIITRQLHKTSERIFYEDISYNLIYELTAIVQDELFSVEQCESNHNNKSTNGEYVYVFSDNIMRTGDVDQAVIRDCFNSFGIATKRYPSNTSGSYMTNDDTDIVKHDLDKLLKLYQSGKVIIFPAAGLGTESSRLESKAPKVFRFMNDYISSKFLMYNQYPQN